MAECVGFLWVEIGALQHFMKHRGRHSGENQIPRENHDGVGREE
jgi:hypothetical protein